MNVIAVVPQGLEQEAAKELVELGATLVKPLKRSVFFKTDKNCFYRVHLMSRIPFRFLREIAKFHCSGPDSLYYQVQNSLDWKLWLPPDLSFRVDVTGHTYGLNHSHFSALQVKNAIVDLQREIWGERSNVNLNDPDICIHLHLSKGDSVLSFDSSSKSLHKRGYRSAMGIAPLKENLAAGLIRITEWDGLMPLVDPFCGSATFLIEAGSIALGLPPGLNSSFLFEQWPDFDLHIWERQREIAKRSRKIDCQLPKIIGCEQNHEIANHAKINILAAGLEEFIDIKVGSFQELILPQTKGIILCNPPYGKRISEEENLITLYKELGSFCKKNAKGWSLWILNGNPRLSHFLNMKSKKRFPISNGGIDCRWLNYLIN
tara:strand:+ start:257 stop:1381 length:1125 start_codon:yes stop_codon:yes gene_type:complete